MSLVRRRTIAVRTTPNPKYVIPIGYQIIGVIVPSAILQRILREYKTLDQIVAYTRTRSVPLANASF